MGFLDTLADILTREPKAKAEYGAMSDALAAQNAGYGATGGLLNAVDPYILNPMASPEHQYVRDTEAALRAGKKPAGMSHDAMERVGMAGIFAGPGAKTADLIALKKAEELAAKGLDNEAVRQATGWFKGMDGKWRFEIDDSASKMTDATDLLRKKPGMVQGKIFDHENLYAAYPELSDMWTMRAGRSESGGGYIHSAKSPAIELGIPAARRPIDLDTLRETNLHELQHAIQEREGFARGGSPENASMYTPEFDAWSKLRGTKTPEEKSAYRAIPSDWDAYQRLAGEIEARDVSARMNLTPEQRLATPPDLRPDAIVRYGNGPQMSVPGYVEDAAERQKNFERWVGDSGYLGKWLHGSDVTDIGTFSGNRADGEIAAFLSPSTRNGAMVADSFASKNFNIPDAPPPLPESGKRPSVYPVHVKSQKVFDANNPEHINQLKDAMGSGFREISGTDDWLALERGDVVRALKGLGYDAMLVRERMAPEDNIAVFGADQIKSIFNRGTYDESGNILKSIIPAAATAYGIEEVLPYD